MFDVNSGDLIKALTVTDSSLNIVNFYKSLGRLITDDNMFLAMTGPSSTYL